MKKKIKIAAGFLTVIFCILLGCERRERESEALFLEETGDYADPSGQGEAEDIALMAQEADAVQMGVGPAADSGSPALSDTENAGSGIAEDNSREADTGSEDCVVHVCGAVNEPGVYTLKNGDRIYQAIEKAGGFREDAEQDYLNQADLLSDGMKIYIPTKEEAREAESGTEWIIPGGGIAVANEQENKSEDENSALVNINTAGEEQLCTLPGVGSSKARSIIAYREQYGAYKAIEEIMNVEGIKEGVFQKIRDSITV